MISAEMFHGATLCRGGLFFGALMGQLPKTLTASEIEVLACVIWDGLSHRKAAEALNLSHTSIQRLLRSGKRKLAAAGLQIRALLREPAQIGTLEYVDEKEIVAVW